MKQSKKVEVVIDDKSGFCAGVVRAIKMAENATQQCPGQTIVSIGDIVHNANEVKRLEKLGLTTAQSLENILRHKFENPIALIRAHGEPPETFQILKQENINVIDATCPVVSKLQLRVKENWLKMKKLGGTVVIFGKRGHAEVVGLVGQTHGEAIVVDSEKDLDNIDFSKPIVMLSQTTQSLIKFEQIKAAIIARAEDTAVVIDTICRSVANRSGALEQFAEKADVILFVSGKKSSNGRALYEICKAVNTNSYFIESEAEIKKEWIIGGDVSRVGVCGATSTPMWQMQAVAKAVDVIVAESC